MAEPLEGGASAPPSGAAKATPSTTRSSLAGLLDSPNESLVDLVDSLLDHGVVLDGELILGLADIDLIYLRLGVLLVAADRVLPPRK